jgi:hypothetical protein
LETKPQNNSVELLRAEDDRDDPVKVTIQDVNRVLEVGRLLFSVLTEEEKASLIRLLNTCSDKNKKGNAGVT